MQGRRVIIAVVAAVCGGLVVPAGAAPPPPVVVEVSDDRFDPANVTHIAESGVILDWIVGIGHKHNVRQDDKFFHSGAPTKDPNTEFEVYAPAGTFHYYCTNHGSKTGGMDGNIRVFPAAEPVSDDTFAVSWGGDLDTPVVHDVRFKVDTGKWRSWLQNAEADHALFGGGGEPVEVKPGKTYKIQARTETVDINEKISKSGWSPTVSVSIET